MSIITSGTTFQNDRVAATAANAAANIARTQASIATSAASNASLSASRAATSATQAQKSADNASNSATLAATFASQTFRNTGNVTTTNITNQPAGSPGWVQISSGGGFTGSTSLTFENSQLNVLGTINSFNSNISGNLNVANLTSISANVTNLRSNTLSVVGNAILGNLNVTGTVTGTFTGNGLGLTGIAPINSPAFTGTPIAPTPSYNNYGSQIATTAFVINQIANFSGISGNTFNVTGNIVSAQNITAGVGMTATGNITGGNLRTTGVITATGNVTTAGNLTVGGTIQSTGNITVATLASNGNISGSNISASGNVNINGNMAVAGNIIASVLTANTSLNAINANVTNSLSVSGGIKQNQFTKLSNSTGQPGQIVWDTNYIYVCTATNVWKRVALSSF